MKLLLSVSSAVAALLVNSCGYQMAGKADLVPKTIHTIAIPAFGNSTTRYKLTDQLPDAIAKEFITRTRYRVVSNADTADAVLRGTVMNYTAGATILDPSTGRATIVELHVGLQITLTERATGKLLFSRPYMDVRERYQIAGVSAFDQKNYFEETDSAIERASRETARIVVSSILENF